MDPINIYNSPASGNFSPMSASFMMYQPMSYYGGMIGHQSMSMNSPFNISSCSSPYVKENLNFPHLSLNTRKYSDNFKKLKFTIEIRTNDVNIIIIVNKVPIIFSKKMN